MSWIVIAAVATASSVSILTLVNVYLYHCYRERFMKIWAIAWGVYAFRYFCLIAAMSCPGNFLLNVTYYLLIIISTVILLKGIGLFIGKPPRKGFAILGGIIFLWTVLALYKGMSFFVIATPTFAFSSIVYIFIGIQIIKHSKRGEVAGRLVGWLFIVWGVHQADYSLLRPIEWFAPWGFLLGGILAISIAISMILIYFERTLKSLQYKESLHRNLIESSHDWIWEVDANCNYTYASPHIKDLLGYTPEEILGKTLYDFKPETEVVRIKNIFEKLSSQKLPIRQLENINHHKNGSIVILESNGVPFFDTKGNYLGYRGMDQNVTDRRKAEDALRERETALVRSQAELRAIYDHAPVMMCLVTTDQRLQYGNAALFAFLGISGDNLKNQDIGSILGCINAQDDPRGCGFSIKCKACALRLAMEDTFNTGVGHKNIEYDSILTKVEGQRAVSLLGSTTLIHSANQNRILLCLHDITERKQAEEAITTSNNLFKTVINTAPIRIFFKDKELRYMGCNNIFAQDAGVECPENLVGKNDYQLKWKEQAELFQADDLQVIESGSPKLSYEEQLITTDGKQIWLRTSKVPLRNNADQVIGVLGMYEDITDQKRTEESLLRKDALLRAMLRNLPFDFWARDSSQRIIMQSDESVRLWGDLVARPQTEENFDNQTLGLWSSNNRRALQGEIISEDCTLTTQNGESREFHNIVAPIREGNDILGLLGINMDITDRKQAEKETEKLQAQLNHSKKIESVGRLAGGVAHDFNNMLSVILGHSEMALEQLDPSQPLFADLLQIRAAGQRSADLTRQLLAFARKQPVAPKVINLNVTIESMLQMLRRLIGENIHLVWEPETNLWSVKIDPTQIDQILANLCVNARDAITGNGKIIIETNRVTLRKKDCSNLVGIIPGDFVLLSISDDGCGIDDETQTKLFEPFFTTKELGKGTGLGLATVYGIIKQNNGFIYVDSELDKGTTFRIYLPRHKSKADQLEQEGLATPTVLGHETILLVEDEPTILEMITRMLQQQGYKVLAANCPRKAIELAEIYAGEIDLLITDVIMPEMNGREMVNNLLPLCPSLKWIFMSGYTADVISDHEISEVNFIQKPFSKQDLTSKISEVLRQNK